MLMRESAIRACGATVMVLLGLTAEPGCSKAPTCVAGQSATCACESGGEGRQVCQAGGTFGSCVCDSADAGNEPSSDAGVPDAGRVPADGGTDGGGADSGVSADAGPPPLFVTFTQPAATGTPPVAVVKGTTELLLATESELPISFVQVTYAGPSGSLPLAQFTAAPYEVYVNWPVELGVGQTVLTATAADTQNNTGTSTLTVQVLCQLDADCGANQRCCSPAGFCEVQSVTPACQMDGGT
jgi:hypothetical protein